MSYTLGEDFELLDAVGRAEDIGGNIKYPFIRSRLYNFYGSFGYEFKRLHDDMNAINQSDPRTSRLWNIGISGNAADGWMGGGMNDYSIVYYNGHLNIDNAMNAIFDSATAKKAGGFQKVVVNYARQQYITDNAVLNTRFEAQIANKNLDSSEKFSLGGANGLRAYPQGEASGDEGYRLTTELQHRLFSIEKNNFYMVNFIDYGHVVINKDAWTSAGDESRNLSDAGIGFMWSRADGFMFRCDYAWKIGPEKAVSDTDHNGHLWVRCVKYF
jgi:hemolysin activation/secretion protein